jgi:hypothetical protein
MNKNHRFSITFEQSLKELPEDNLEEIAQS